MSIETEQKELLDSMMEFNDFTTSLDLEIDKLKLSMINMMSKYDSIMCSSAIKNKYKLDFITLFAKLIVKLNSICIDAILKFDYSLKKIEKLTTKDRKYYDQANDMYNDFKQTCSQIKLIFMILPNSIPKDFEKYKHTDPDIIKALDMIT
jgi:hypothetical protein